MLNLMGPKMRCGVCVALSWVVLGLLLGPTAGLAGAADKEDTNSWDRIVVIGASASAGWQTKSEAGTEADVELGKLIEAMLKDDDRTVKTAASPMFFLQTDQVAEKVIAQAKDAQPTLLVAVDFLFWFGYGMYPSEDARLAALEKGIGHLEQFSCPILVSEFTDMRDSVGKPGGLQSGMVPDVRTLGLLNRRIQLWAESKKNVTIVPLKSVLEQIRANRPVKVGKNRWKKGSLTQLLQNDQLHPTLEGLALIAALSLESVMKVDKKARKAFSTDVKDALKRLQKKLKPTAEKSRSESQVPVRSS